MTPKMRDVFISESIKAASNNIETDTVVGAQHRIPKGKAAFKNVPVVMKKNGVHAWNPLYLIDWHKSNKVYSRFYLANGFYYSVIAY